MPDPIKPPNPPVGANLLAGSNNPSQPAGQHPPGHPQPVVPPMPGTPDAEKVKADAEALAKSKATDAHHVATTSNVDPAQALHTIATSLSSLAGQSAAAAAPPAPSDGRPGGMFRVAGRLVDAEGTPIADDDAEKHGANLDPKASKP